MTVKDGVRMVSVFCTGMYLLFVVLPALSLTEAIKDVADARDRRYSLIARYQGPIRYSIAWLVMLPFHRGREEVIAEWEAESRC